MNKDNFKKNTIRKQLRVSPEFQERIKWITENGHPLTRPSTEAEAIKKAVQILSDKLGFTLGMF